METTDEKKVEIELAEEKFCMYQLDMSGSFMKSLMRTIMLSDCKKDFLNQ